MWILDWQNGYSDTIFISCCFMSVSLKIKFLLVKWTDCFNLSVVRISVLIKLFWPIYKVCSLYGANQTLCLLVAIKGILKVEQIDIRCNMLGCLSGSVG